MSADTHRFSLERGGEVWSGTDGDGDDIIQLAIDTPENAINMSLEDAERIGALARALQDESAHEDDRPTISVHELQHWFVSYALRHAGTERERIADEIADFIDQERAAGARKEGD